MLDNVFIEKIPEADTLAVDPSVSIFPDGIAISLDHRWGSNRMTLDPERRNGG